MSLKEARQLLSSRVSQALLSLPKDKDDVEKISALERCAILESQEMLDEQDISQPAVDLENLLDDVSVPSADSKLKSQKPE